MLNKTHNTFVLPQVSGKSLAIITYFEIVTLYLGFDSANKILQICEKKKLLR